MPNYMLAVHGSTEDPSAGPPPGEAQMQQRMAALQELEADLASAGAWVFSGALTDPGSATVVLDRDGTTTTTDGPFVESKEHVAGFYVIDADDLDDALRWAARVTACVGAPIEVRPFAATGRVADQVGAA